MDDFAYSRNSEAVWEESHSVVSVLVAQISNTKDIYFSWQGTFFSTWFTTSMLGIFGKNAYYIGTYLSLGGFALAELLLFFLIFIKIFQTDFFTAGIVAMSCISLQILMTPWPSEAYFWLTGAVVYTFIHALALFLTATLIGMYYADKVWKVVVLEILAVLLTIAVGGGNYVTGLTMLIIYGLGTLWTIYKKHSYRWVYLGNTLLYTAMFMVNMLAPGNSHRQSSSGVDHMSAIGAILSSLKEAAEYIAVNIYLPCVILGIMFLPLLIKIVRKSKYRYPFPILISILSFGVFAAQFTPTLYAQGITGAGRILNLYRLNFYILLYGNELYWTGWLVRRLEKRYQAVEREPAKDSAALLLPGWCFGGVVLCYTLVFWGGVTLTSVSAIMSLRTGQAQQYYMENQERLAVLEDESLDEVYLNDFTYKPYLLYFGDIQEDPADWRNRDTAAYFGKKAIYLLKQGE